MSILNGISSAGHTEDTPESEVDDGVLLSAIHKGNAHAAQGLECIHRRYRNRLFPLIRAQIKKGMLFNEDDVLQEVWWRFLRKPPLAVENGSLWPWLLVATLNCVRTLSTKASAQKRTPPGARMNLGRVQAGEEKHIFPATDAGSPDSIACNNEILSVIQGMNSELREVLQCMIDYPDLHIRDMAKMMHVSKRTFERRLTEARAALAEKLQLEIPVTFKKTPGKRSKPA